MTVTVHIDRAWQSQDIMIACGAGGAALDDRQAALLVTLAAPGLSK
jgi:hypothetical protein